MRAHWSGSLAYVVSSRPVRDSHSKEKANGFVGTSPYMSVVLSSIPSPPINK